MQDFKNLRVWHLANEVSMTVVELLPVQSARRVPGLRNQAIRAAMSVSANLAEGASRKTRIEFLRFVEIALGSHNELDAHLRLARDTGVLSDATHRDRQRHLDLLRRMLISLMQTLQRRIADEHATPHNPTRPSPFRR